MAVGNHQCMLTKGNETGGSAMAENVPSLRASWAIHPGHGHVICAATQGPTPG